MNGRDPLDLLGLAPGIRIQGGFGGKNGSWGNFSSNGGLANANVVMVEGLALDLAQMNAPSFVPPVDATEEFRVQTNKFSAEYGRTAGAVVNFSIKSGTNSLHGSAYEFLRNKSLNANNFFHNRSGDADGAASIQNQFGASMRRADQERQDVLFLQLGRISATARVSPSITTVPTALQRTGDFSQTFNSAGSLVAIADPLTTAPVAGRQLTPATLFAGNVIPVHPHQPGGRAMSPRFIRSQTQPGNPFTHVNNYSTVGGGGNNEHQIVSKAGPQPECPVEDVRHVLADLGEAVQHRSPRL